MFDCYKTDMSGEGNGLSTTENDDPTARPSLVEVIEAVLFVGREPVRSESFCQAFADVSVEAFDEAIRELRGRYRRESRPYDVRRQDDGFVLELRDPYRSELVQRMMGQRQIKLSRAAIDVLSVATYRQPITKTNVDEIVGFDSGSALRQLVRRGLLQTGPSAEDETIPAYSTAPRFLELFGLESTDDIPSSDELDRPY